MRRLLITIATVLMLAAITVHPVMAASGSEYPAKIALPASFYPDGIAVDQSGNFYLDSNSGAVYRGSLRTGEGQILIQPGADRTSAAIKIDPRTNYLFLAGGPSGRGTVFDARTGAQLASYQFAPGGVFVNDVAVTRSAAYFTDCSRPYFYKVTLGPNGELPDMSAVWQIPYGGEIRPRYVSPNSVVSGCSLIEATPDGRWLIILNTAMGRLFRVDPATGEGTTIDVGGDIKWADSMALIDEVLYVVQASGQISAFRLNADVSSGSVEQIPTQAAGDAVLHVPGRAAAFGGALYVVDTPYYIVPAAQPAPGASFAVVRAVGNASN